MSEKLTESKGVNIIKDYRELREDAKRAGFGEDLLNVLEEKGYPSPIYEDFEENQYLKQMLKEKDIEEQYKPGNYIINEKDKTTFISTGIGEKTNMNTTRKLRLQDIANRREDAKNKVDTTYITHKIFTDEVVYIGTNEVSKSDYYANSQFLIIRRYDLNDEEFSFRVDMKNVRIHGGEKGCAEWYMSYPKNKEISIKDIENDEYLTITIEDLYDLLDNEWLTIHDLRYIGNNL